MQDEMIDLMDVSNEIQETLDRSYIVPDDFRGGTYEHDALEAHMDF